MKPSSSFGAHGVTTTLTRELDALRSAATTLNQYVPGALKWAVVAPHAASGGLAQVTRNVPSGTSRPVGPGGVASGAVPSPNVTVPGPRNLLHQHGDPSASRSARHDVRVGRDRLGRRRGDGRREARGPGDRHAHIGTALHSRRFRITDVQRVILIDRGRRHLRHAAVVQRPDVLAFEIGRDGHSKRGSLAAGEKAGRLAVVGRRRVNLVGGDRAAPRFRCCCGSCSRTPVRSCRQAVCSSRRTWC